MVGVQNRLFARERGHKKQERRARQVKIGHQAVDGPERVAGSDEEFRIAFSGRNRAIGFGAGLQYACGCGARGDDAAAFSSRPVYGLRGFLGQGVSLAMQSAGRKAGCVNRAKCPDAHVEDHFGIADALGFQLFKQGLGQVESGRGARPRRRAHERRRFGNERGRARALGGGIHGRALAGYKAEEGPRPGKVGLGPL